MDVHGSDAVIIRLIATLAMVQVRTSALGEQKHLL